MGGGEGGWGSEEGRGEEVSLAPVSETSTLVDTAVLSGGLGLLAKPLVRHYPGWRSGPGCKYGPRSMGGTGEGVVASKKSALTSDRLMLPRNKLSQ